MHWFEMTQHIYLPLHRCSCRGTIDPICSEKSSSGLTPQRRPWHYSSIFQDCGLFSHMQCAPGLTAQLQIQCYKSIYMIFFSHCSRYIVLSTTEALGLAPNYVCVCVCVGVCMVTFSAPEREEKPRRCVIIDWIEKCRFPSGLFRIIYPLTSEMFDAIVQGFLCWQLSLKTASSNQFQLVSGPCLFSRSNNPLLHVSVTLRSPTILKLVSSQYAGSLLPEMQHCLEAPGELLVYHLHPLSFTSTGRRDSNAVWLKWLYFMQGNRP